MSTAYKEAAAATIATTVATTIEALTIRVRKPVTSEREAAAILRHLAVVARDQHDYALGLLLDILCEEGSDLGGAWRAQIARLGMRYQKTNDVLVQVCGIAVAALASWDAYGGGNETRAPSKPSLASAKLDGAAVRIQGKPCTFAVEAYQNGRLAIVVKDAQGEIVATLTTNKVEIEPDDGEVYVEAFGENEALAGAALATKLFEDTGARVPAGLFGKAQVWRIR